MHTTDGDHEPEPLHTQHSAHERMPASAEVAAEARRQRGADHDPGRSLVADTLVFGAGIPQAEQAEIVGILQGLDDQLAGLDATTLEMEVWVRGRDTSDQTTYLRVRSGPLDLVASSTAPSLVAGVRDVKDRMRRQLSDARDRRSRRRR